MGLENGGNESQWSKPTVATRHNQTPSQLLVAAPKEYFLGPVFAASKQVGPREVTIGDHRYQIGGFHPLRPDLRPPGA